MACDCLDTSDERLIRGITREVNKIPLVRVNLNSKQVNGLVTIGMHDGIPVGYDCLLGYDLVLQSDCNKGVAVVTRSSSKPECKSISNQKLFNSVMNRSNEILKTPQDVDQSKISFHVALDKNDLVSKNQQDVLESLDLSSSSSDESISISLNNVECKTSMEPSQLRLRLTKLRLGLRLTKLSVRLRLTIPQTIV